jgi:hypothetical protein
MVKLTEDKDISILAILGLIAMKLGITNQELEMAQILLLQTYNRMKTEEQLKEALGEQSHD